MLESKGTLLYGKSKWLSELDWLIVRGLCETWNWAGLKWTSSRVLSRAWNWAALKWTSRWGLSWEGFWQWKEINLWLWVDDRGIGVIGQRGTKWSWYQLPNGCEREQLDHITVTVCRDFRALGGRVHSGLKQKGLEFHWLGDILILLT